MKAPVKQKHTSSHMANKFEEQKNLATIIKNIHQDLRDSTQELGADEAWSKHLENKEKLNLYAKSMRELSEVHWKERNATADDRIEWVIKSCDEYFQEKVIEEHRRKDLEIIEKLKSEGNEIDMSHCEELKIGEKIKVIDVGASGNFFKKNERFDILALDIAPSSDEVLYCDFFSVPVSKELAKDDKKVHSLPVNYFDAVIFCLLLEYMPTSEMRVKCCEKAYGILKTEGILCLITPDSNYQHTNAQQIKTWKWTLANIGFKRIKLEKLTNLSCMVFRKSLSKEIPRRWAGMKKDSFIELRMDIPQDRKKTQQKEATKTEKCEYSVDMMHELPFE
jgi:25S rRNA (adenine2142-N1)-methyltransferase